MTKKDYMCLPKERLAELLVERDNAPSFIPYSPLPLYQSRPLCWEPGGLCTNPMRDYINCPRMTTMEMYNTTSGTSTGNTSATDGKEHNPSFTELKAEG